MKSRPSTSFIESRVCLATVVMGRIATDITGSTRPSSQATGACRNGV